MKPFHPHHQHKLIGTVVVRSLIAASIDNSAPERGRLMFAKRNVKPWMTNQNAEIKQLAMTHMTIAML
jgi:hypothetical protein